MARNAQTQEQRAQLLTMADTWEGLATQRERLLMQQENVEAAFEALPVAPAESGEFQHARSL